MKQFLQFGQRLITVTGKCIGFKEVPKMDREGDEGSKKGRTKSGMGGIQGVSK